MNWDTTLDQQRAAKKAIKRDLVAPVTAVSFSLKVMPGFVDAACKAICDIVEDFELKDSRDIAGVGISDGYKVTVYESGSILFQRVGRGPLPEKVDIRQLLLNNEIRLCG
jgi:hypothetical protein